MSKTFPCEKCGADTNVAGVCSACGHINSRLPPVQARLASGSEISACCPGPSSDDDGLAALKRVHERNRVPEGGQKSGLDMSGIFCVQCGTLIPTPPDGVVHSGYCSDACWKEWLEKHKHDMILRPYVPLQVSHLDCWYLEEIKSSTACKHGEHDCEACGTSSKRDYKHKTVGGKGLIGRIK